MKTQKSAIAIFACIISVFVSSSLAAEEPSAHDVGGKIGIEAGYPVAITGGYRFSKDFEANILFGYYYSPEVIVGANGLFRLTSLTIGDDPFPLSIGPEVLLHVGGSAIGLDTVMMIRLENTMRPAPFNFFIEAGLGLSILPQLGLQGTGALGARLVLDHPALKVEK